MMEYDEMPTSAAQRSIWLAQRLSPESARYLVPAVIDLVGELDVAALCAGVQSLVDRHEALRTGFAVVDGIPVQRVFPAASAVYVVVDVSHEEHPDAAADEDTRTAMAVPFDLAGPSLLRVRVVRLGPTQHRLVVLAHHLICDAWSSTLLIRDLAYAYRAALDGTAAHRAAAGGQVELAPLAIQFADYAVWQHQILTPAAIEEHLDHWRGVLDPLPEPLALPVGRPRPTGRGDRGAVVHTRLPAGEAGAIIHLARSVGTTPYAVILTGLAIVLSRLTGQTDIMLGSIIATRDQTELSDVVGCLINTLPLRVVLDDDPPFADLVARVRDALLDAFEHRHLPFEHIVERLRVPRDPSRLPLCDVLATMQTAPQAVLELPGLVATVRRLPTATAKADLTIEAIPLADGGLDLHVEYDQAILDPDLAEWTVAALRRAIARGNSHPTQSVATIDLSTPQELAALLALAKGPSLDAAPSTIWQRFAERSAQAGHAPAVDAPDRALTYAELSAEAEQLCGRLIATGVRPGDRVGVCTGRTSSWPVALLGVLRARAAFVPLDPTVPRSRLQFMLDDAGAAIVVADAVGAAALSNTGHILRADPGVARTDPPPLRPPSVSSQPLPEDLAYVIYTSGSTGRPKGVAIQNAGLVRLIDATRPLVGLGVGDRVLQFASPGFDAAVLDFSMALLNGATLCLADPATLLPGPLLRDTLRRLRISFALVQPSALALVPAEPPLPDLRVLLTGGEAPDATLLARWAPGRTVINAYGPTEATIWATAWRCPQPPPPAPPPIGQPLPGVSAHVLDARLCPVPVGLPGELYLGGANLARGYLGSATLTAQRFLPDPFGPASGRLYRTGDRVVRRRDGELVFLGRTDAQVKIRGFRVEPAEAENVLSGHPEVAAAAVIARDQHGETTLVGYYVLSPGATMTAARLRAALADLLPGHLVPAHLIELPMLPLTPSGKLDQAALPPPMTRSGGRGPSTPWEHTIAHVWRDVLRLDAVGVEDNFFDLGGHSLALAQVHARLVVLTGREIPIVELFRHTTIAALAAHLGASPTDHTRPAPNASAAIGKQRGQARRAVLTRSSVREAG